MAQAQIALESGQDQEALYMVMPLLDRDLGRSQDYSLVLETLSRSESPEKVIGYFVRIPRTFRSKNQDSLVALAYLQLAQKYANIDDRESEGAALLQVLRYRPDDLYANNQMRLRVLGQDNARVYSDRLRLFSKESVLPENSRFLRFNAKVIPDLLASSIWNRSTARPVIAALVWAYPQSKEVENLLLELEERFPGDAELDVRYHLGELYQRRGEWQEAARVYAGDAGSFDSLRNLFLICKERPFVCDPAAVTLAATVVDRAKRQSLEVGDVCLSQNYLGSYCSQADLQSGVEPDASYHVGGFGRFPANARWGPNLLPNSAFRTWDNLHKPTGWLIEDMHYGNGSGAFAGGSDRLYGTVDNGMVRLFGFWGLSPYSSIGLRVGVGSGFDGVRLQPGNKYSLSVEYLTEANASPVLTLWTPSFWPICNSSSNTPAPKLSEVQLPPTRGLWVVTSLSLCPSGDSETIIAPAVRLWSPGSVWVRRISVQEGK